MFQLYLFMLLGALSGAAEPHMLDLSEAETMALERDPTTRALLARSAH